jgi:hypothetical protein
MPTRKLSQKKIKAANKAFEKLAEFIIKNGGSKDDGWFYRFTMPVKTGLMHLHPEVGTHIHSLFCRFGNVKAAKELLGDSINPHSGKWNFHSTDIDEMMSQFYTEIEPLLETK